MAEIQRPEAFQKTRPFDVGGGGIRRFEWSPSGEQIAAIDPAGLVYVWDISSEHVSRQVGMLDTRLECLAWSPDSRNLAIGTDSALIIYHLEDLRKTVISDHYGPVLSASWSPQSHYLVTGGSDKTIKLRDGSTGAPTAVFFGHDGAIRSLAWSHAGDRFASTSLDGTLKVWNVAGEQLCTLQGPTRIAFREVDWAPDGRELAVGCDDGSVQIIDCILMRVSAILEGHTSQVTTVSYSPDGEILLSASKDGTVRLWATESWRELVVLKEFGDHFGFHPRARFHPGELVIGCLKGATGVLESYRLDASVILGAAATSPSVYYTNAKVVLLGDTGVGKSGLGLVLTGQGYMPTDSTHARKIWKFDSEVVKIDKYHKEVRETVLWDLAGQPGYRLIHQLSLNEVAIALLVFDSRSETDPFGSVRYWDRAVRLEENNRTGVPWQIKKFLVAARIDRGGIGVSQKRIQKLVEEVSAEKYIATSAKDGTNIAQLREMIRKSIDWNILPRVTSTEMLNKIKHFLLEQKQGGILLVSLEDLYATFLANEHVHPSAQIKTQFTASIRLVEARGVIRRLSFGDLVLLQPEMLDVYASAMVNEAREEPDGLGYLLEEDAKEGNFPIPLDERVQDRSVERLLLIATIEELLRHEVAFKDTSNSDISVIVFPAQFTREWPEAPDPAGKAVVFSFEGPVANAYCTLVIRLARSGMFKIKEMWRNTVVYDGPGNSQCGLFLQTREEGRAELTLFYRSVPNEATRSAFEEFVHTHLVRKTLAPSVMRRQVIVCVDCDTEITAAQVKARRERGYDWAACNVCGNSVALVTGEGRFEAHAMEDIAKMDRAADELRDREVATETVDGKRAVRDFDVFLCHNSKDKAFVREISARLKAEGILPWLDEEQIPPGQPWQKILEQDMKRIRCAVVFIGDKIGAWQDQEVQVLLEEFVRRKKTIIPVLLPGTLPDEASRRTLKKKLPLFLRNLEWVDFGVEDSKPFHRLLWGITGIRSRAEHGAEYMIRTQDS